MLTQSARLCGPFCPSIAAMPCAVCAAHKRMLATVEAAMPPLRRVDSDRSPRGDVFARHAPTVAASAALGELR